MTAPVVRWPTRQAPSGTLYAWAIGATKAYDGRLRCRPAARTPRRVFQELTMGHAEFTLRNQPRKSRCRSTNTGCRSRRTAISRPIRRSSSAPKGMYYWNDRGEKIIDASSGLFCVAAGHGRKEIAEAVHRQLCELDFVAAVPARRIRRASSSRRASPSSRPATSTASSSSIPAPKRSTPR